MTLLTALDGARRQIRVLAYLVTDRTIIAVLIAAKQRGVDVQAVLDPANEWTPSGRPGSAVRLAGAGIPVWIDHAPGLEHNKIMIIDNDLVVGGSYNYTHSAAVRNIENMTLIRSETVARRFLGDWEIRKKAAERFSEMAQ